jgi:hypothetical protein
MQINLRFSVATLFCLFLFSGLVYAAESVSIRSTLDGITAPCRVTQNGAASANIEVDIPAIAINPITLNSTEYKEVQLPAGEHLFSAEMAEDGKPTIPALTVMLAIPDQAGVQLSVSYSGFDIIDNFDLAPVQPSPADNNPDADIPFTIDQQVYSNDEFYPGDLAEAADPIIMRDIRGVQISLYPVQYNPVRRQLRVYHDLSVCVTDGGPVINPKTTRRDHLSEGFYPLYKSMFANFEQLYSTEDVQRGGYVIICKPSLADTLKALALWKHKKGYTTRIVRSTEIASSGNPSYTQIFNYLRTAYQSWTVPPEYVMIVGDMDNLTLTGIADYPYSSYASDHHFACVDGTDYIPDIFVARASIDNLSELRRVIAKILKYEEKPLMRDPEHWIRGLSIAYTYYESSRLTTLWVRQLQLQHGFARVDTVMGQNPSSNIATWINNGVGYVQYRGAGSSDGWWGPSFTIADLNALQNTNKLGVWAILTCGTGDFSADVCFGETWLRMGIGPDSLKGGPAYYGVSDHNTHTRWNNPIMVGYYFGIFDEGVTHFAAAAVRGKLQEYRTFPRYRGAGNYVEQYFNTYNMLGDPELELRTTIPILLNVTHPETLAFGLNHFELNVVDTSGAPVKDAIVSLIKMIDSTEEVYSVGKTDEAGNVSLSYRALTTGTMAVTVSGQNLYPYEGTVDIVQSNVAVGLDSLVVDDDNTGYSRGNGDGIVNPGETLELSVSLKNYGNDLPANGVVTSLEPLDDFVTIIDATRNYGSLNPGESRFAGIPYLVNISPNAQDGNICRIKQTVIDQNNDFWYSVIEIPIQASKFVVNSIAVQDPNSRLDPGDTVNLVITIKNGGHADAQNVTAAVTTVDDYSAVIMGNIVFGDIPRDSIQNNASTPATVFVAPETFIGRSINFVLNTTTASGAKSSVPFTVPVGLVSTTDPIGPDAYGYYMYDNTDVSYSPCPTYQWVELVPGLGGQGTKLNYGGNIDDKSLLVNLPFDFVYYGVPYRALIVCTNGFVSPDTARMDMGGNYWANFFNWPIPDPGNARGQISPLWDDLSIPSGINYGIFTWNDTTQHKYYIEWNRMVQKNLPDSTEYFEMVITDPAYDPTLTGDSEILFHYLNVNNLDNEYPETENYSTVGFESFDELTGLQYTHDNQNTPGAPNLVDGRAIKITTNTGRGGIKGHVNLSNGGQNQGVRVEVTSGQYRITPPSGDFWLTNVPPGLVSLNAAAAGYFPQHEDNITITINSTISGFNYDLVLCPQPESVDASDNYAHRIDVHWHPITDPSLTGYYVYRGLWENGEFNKLNTSPISGTSYSDTTAQDSVTYWYYVTGAYTQGTWNGESFASRRDSGRLNGSESMGGESAPIPASFFLSQNYPNPFNPTTTISYGLPKDSQVKVEVFNLLGQRIRVLVDGYEKAGYKNLIWDGHNSNGEEVSSGVYLFRIEAGSFNDTRKMTLLR